MKKENRIFKRKCVYVTNTTVLSKRCFIDGKCKNNAKMAFLMMYDLVLQIQNLKFIHKKFFPYFSFLLFKYFQILTLMIRKLAVLLMFNVKI